MDLLLFETHLGFLFRFGSTNVSLLGLVPQPTYGDSIIQGIGQEWIQRPMRMNLSLLRDLPQDQAPRGWPWDWDRSS